LTVAQAAAGGEPGDAGRRWAADTDPLALGVLLALVIACFAAFFITQRLKHTPTAVQNFELLPVFSPYPGGHVGLESISFKLARADEVTVTVLNARNDTVATLTRDHPVARYKQFSLRWNGRRGTAHHERELRTASGRAVLVPVLTGPLAAPGEYRVHVHLRHQGIDVSLLRSFRLVKG
jgi:hypothetical protein